MKYDIDPAEANSSHAQILDLVPPGSTVLDVGCSTGYLARILVERGCTVVGVEMDPEAAEVARPTLAELVIGDLETLDLVGALGAGRFDRIVFADVLEHLRAPLDVLRQAPALLAEGGSVVVSIPNVAHADVRLSLLEGRFEYRDLGLLDDTHLRFFTRRTVDELHRLAGLAPVEHRRTVAPPFTTEIPVTRDVPAEVLADLAADPESTTYQFVIRSVPAGSAALVGDDLAAELVARDQELQEARHALAGATAVAARARPPVVGVVTADGGPLDELRRLVVLHELRRRLPGWDLRSYALGTTFPGAGADGRAVRPLVIDGSPTDRSAPALAAAVLTGTWSGEELEATTPAIAEDGCPWHLAGVTTDAAAAPTSRPPAAVTGPPGSGCPDPLLLADRLWPGDLVALRAGWLRSTGRLPGSGGSHVLVSLSGTATAAAERGLGALVDEHGGEVVPADGLEGIDLLAAVATASLVVADVPGLLWLALATRTPCIGVGDAGTPSFASLVAWLDDPDLVVASPAGLAGAHPVARQRIGGAELRWAIDELELLADDLADRLAADGTTLPASLATRLAEALERATVAETVNEALRSQLDKHRRASFDVARHPVGVGGGGHVRALEDRATAAEARAVAAEAEAAHLRGELQATNATVTMRVLNPARQVYGRLRNLP